MMRKFELCYPFPDQEYTYLVPDLLPKEEQFTGEWGESLAFEIHYNVLPTSIISRFIVRMHRYILQHTVWRTGVLIALNENQTLVRADLADDRILIRVRGPVAGRRELLTRIREQFDAIHHTIQGLQAEEKVPLPGHPELPPVDYQWLRRLESASQTEFTPPGCIDPMSVSQLLDGVEPPSIRRADREVSIYNIDARGARISAIGDRSEVRNISSSESEPQSIQKESEMDPITGAIVAALTAGVLGGVTEVGKRAIVDTYEALKAAIKRKYGEDSKLAQAIAAVEDEPEFEPNQQALAGRVEQVDAEEDPELQQLSQELLKALEETSQGKEALSKYNIQATDSQIGIIGDHAQVDKIQFD
jgi:hypothetical protein